MWEGDASTSEAALGAFQSWDLVWDQLPVELPAHLREGDVTPGGSAAPDHEGWLKSEKKYDFEMVEDFLSCWCFASGLGTASDEVSKLSLMVEGLWI